MEEIDTDKNGGIDFSEFLNFMTTERNSRKNSDASEYSEIFDIMVSIYVKQQLNLSHSNELQCFSRSSFILMMAAIIFTTKFIQPHF